MPSRVITFFLAFVLLWSGLSTIEAPRTSLQPPLEQQAVSAQAGGPAATHEGSVEHHHLDDVPSQAQHDPPTESLLPALLKPSAQPLLMAQPHTFVSAAVGPPFLAGPLRPPCSGALTG